MLTVLPSGALSRPGSRAPEMSLARPLAHQMEDVAELLLLGAEILEILLVRLDLERHALDDLQTVALDAGALAGVVRDDAHLAHAEVAQDLRADAVVAEIRREAEPLVGLDRVETLLILQPVGLDLVLQPDAAAFLPHVEEYAAALGLDHLHRGLELLAAVAAHRAEGVARQALAVDAHEHRHVGRDLAH